MFLIFYLLMPTQSNILIEYFNKNQNYKNDQQSYVNWYYSWAIIY